ncbi:spore germination protein, partial [Senegalia sp. (in: firmicutes)]
FIDNIVNKDMIYDFLLKPLMIESKDIDLSGKTENNLMDIIVENIIPDADMKKINQYKDLFQNLLSGETIILIDNCNSCFSAGTISFQDRGVTEPSSQNVIKGPKDAFCETLKTNISLVRRRIKNVNLRVEKKIIGKETNTNIAIMYLENIADEKVLKKLNDRLNKIDIDSILGSEYIEELIQDQPYSPFPRTYNTERPDVIASGLLEGRVAIIVDGSPFVILVPSLFVEFFQAAEDYYQGADISSLIRILRYGAFFLSLFTPAIFIALTTFHPETIPPGLLISIVAQREGIPFPALVEILIMELTFEILREAIIRMPKTISTAISIVGALVLGDAAIQAGFVSPAAVIVVSLTALSSFISPSYNIAITARILRFIFMLLGSSFGFFGVTIGLIIMLLHLCSLESFGVPYMSPMAPLDMSGQKDTFIRLPVWYMFRRPRMLSDKNNIRQQKPLDAKPKKPKK